MKPFQVYPLFDITPVRGEGCYLVDDRGQTYLDFYGGHAVISIGHAHPHFVQRIKSQLGQLLFYSNSVQNPLQVELAQKLGTLSNLESYHLFLCNSGAEANENALKLASFANKKTEVIAFQQGFHGRTAAAVNITDNPKIKAPLNHGFTTHFVKLGDLAHIQQLLQQDKTCAVIIEGIQGVGGIHVPDPQFLQQLAALCQEYGVALILDEVQSGYGRTGTFFAFQSAGVKPDLVTVAKGMGNGYPIGGVLIHPKYQSQYGQLGTTFGGHHLACAAGVAVLEVLEEEDLIQRAATLGTYLKNALSQVPGVVEVRGNGLMLGLSLPVPAKTIRTHLLYEEQVFTGSSSDPSVLRLLPPLTINQEQVDYFLEKFEKTIRQEVGLIWT